MKTEKVNKKDQLLKRAVYAVVISWWVCLIRTIWFMSTLRAAENNSLSDIYEKRLWGRCRLRHLVDYIEFRHPHWCFEPGGWLSKQLGISIIRAGNYTIESGDVDLEKESPESVVKWQVMLVSALKVEYLLKKSDISFLSAEPKKVTPKVITAPTVQTESVPLDLTTMAVEEFVEVNSGHR